MLAEEGYLENEAAGNHRGTGKLRNAVTHGDLSAGVQGEQVEGLLKQLRAIADDVEVAGLEHQLGTSPQH